jgi:hypothetical protein
MRSGRFFPVSLAAAVAALALGVSCTQNPPAAPANRPLAVASNPAPAAASVANAAGTWTWAYDGGAAGGQAITHTYVLKQNGETLTGTFKDTYDETPADIKDGKIHDGQVTFSVARPFGDSTMNFTFKGKLDRDTIKGTCEWTMADQPNTAEWNAKRGS